MKRYLTMDTISGPLVYENPEWPNTHEEVRRKVKFHRDKAAWYRSQALVNDASADAWDVELSPEQPPEAPQAPQQGKEGDGGG